MTIKPMTFANCPNEWNTGMKYWNTGMKYWNTGMKYWNTL